MEPSLAHTAATNTLRQLHAALIELEEDLTSAGDQLYSGHVTDAFHIADVCMRKGLDLNVRTRRQVRLGVVLR